MCMMAKRSILFGKWCRIVLIHLGEATELTKNVILLALVQMLYNNI